MHRQEVAYVHIRRTQLINATCHAQRQNVSTRDQGSDSTHDAQEVVKQVLECGWRRQVPDEKDADHQVIAFMERES